MTCKITNLEVVCQKLETYDISISGKVIKKLDNKYFSTFLTSRARKLKSCSPDVLFYFI